MTLLLHVNNRLTTLLIDNNNRLITLLINSINRVVTRLIDNNVAMGGGGYAIQGKEIFQAFKPSRFFNRVKGCYVVGWSVCMEYLIGGHPSNDEPFSVWYSELLMCQACSPK